MEYLFSRIVSTASALGARIDWILISAVLLLASAGLITMNSFSGENYFFERQLIWISISIFVFLVLSFVDFRFLKKTNVIVSLFVASVAILLFTLIFGDIFQGAQSWIDVGAFSVQTSDPIKIVVLLLLAKYFSRRHVDIANYRHILVSGLYMIVIVGLVFLQPDFGSAIIIFSLWLGMILVAGISKKHLLIIFLIGLMGAGGLWTFVFEDYQKQRIVTFINPLTDLQGAGYNAYQSQVAVGSGELTGKGIGGGTQSRLEFLPEYETDFIFAAFAEEWGFFGVLLLLILFGVIIWRLLSASLYGASNFETLFGIGVAILIMSHFTVHVGMNIGLLPVTGTTLPFMSYGGSHLITEFAALGIFMGMRFYSHPIHRADREQELIGVDIESD
jgi:rod shape determining protein RodA